VYAAITAPPGARENGRVPDDGDTLLTATRPAHAAADGVLALMHGRGTSERDLAGLFDLLDPERRLHCAAPRGPLQIPGQPGNHWYAVERVGFPDPQTFARSYEMLGDWLGGVIGSLDVPPDRAVLGGFSQGTVMAYALGLGAGRPRPAGILALSGFVPEVDGWEPDLDSRRGMPVFISHGAADPIIEVGFARAARGLLVPAGLDVSYRESPGGHWIDGPTVDAAREWLERALPRQPIQI
jgi:phospholipase/carboxylesterase